MQSAFTIVAFRSPSSDSDSAHSVYLPAEDSPSAPSLTIAPVESASSVMNDDRVAALEQAFAELQAKEARTQEKLDILIDHLQQRQVPSPISDNRLPPPPNTPTPSARPPPPALPNDFDGDRAKGPAFLNSCQTYMLLCADSFPFDQTKICWTLSYMKQGRAAKWAAHVFRYEEDNVGHTRFLDWLDFKEEF